MRFKTFFFVAVVAAFGALFTSAAVANTTQYSFGFDSGVGDWGGAITPDSGTATVDGGVPNGAWSFFDGAVDPAVWPAEGYLTQTDVYLDPAAMAAGDGFDLSVSSANKAGDFLRDFVFHVGMTSDNQLLVNADNNSYGSVNEYVLRTGGDGTPATITDAGWYTFQHVFHDAGDGTLAVDMRVLDAAGNEVFSIIRNNPTDVIADVVGGVHYEWFVLAVGDYTIDNQLLEFVTSAPGDKADCKDGGFENFGFDNQGQCIASLQANSHAGK